MKIIKYIFCVLVAFSMMISVCIASDDGAIPKDWDAQPEICQATLGGVPVTLEVADDGDERRRGLMYRASMPEDFGMLFIFEDEQTRRFWMKNTLIDLDIAFLDKEGIIVDIKRMNKYSERTTVSDQPAMYAVEMNAGWFPRNNVVKGDKLDLVRVPE